MGFIFSLFGTIFAVFLFTIINLYNWWPSSEVILSTSLRYVLLPIEVYTSKTFFIVTSLFMLVTLSFVFLIPGWLMCVQLTNLISNRTTNERYSKKKVVTRSVSTISEKDSMRSDSTGSSLLSTVGIMRPEDIIN
jgi:hypothetical protein